MDGGQVRSRCVCVCVCGGGGGIEDSGKQE